MQYREVSRPVVLFVGLIGESKGVSIALDACRRVLPEVPNVLFKFMGRFESKEYEVEVGRTIEEYGINENVVFLGEQTGRSKWESFSSAWVFCYPTYFEAESFGLVVAEAMGLGIPVVASRWRGVQSLVLDGETGYLVPVRDARTLAQSLTQILLNHELRAAMGAAGRQRFLDEYSLNRFHQSMATIFRSLR